MAYLTVGATLAGFLALGSVLYTVIVFNGLIRLKFNVDKAWANIDVLLKQRHDLVPALVEVVKGYRDFERKTLADLTAARAQALGAVSPPDKARANDVLEGVLGRVFAVAENYPALRAQRNFLELQKTLSRLESAIADRRTFYNDSVAAYNSRLSQFPDLLLARLLGLEPRFLFTADRAGREGARVDWVTP
ncbi:MAG TPA: LemA family protein [bacterium]|nr:LemA family protein [bacterium]